MCMPPQVGCQLEETVMIGVDVNGCVGKGTRDDEVLGRCGVKEKNADGQVMVDCR